MDSEEKLIWKAGWSVGNRELDLQHRTMIDLINELDTEDAQFNPRVFAGILARITNCFIQHCNDEEAYMKRNAYPFLQKHKAEHQAFIRVISMYNLDYNSHQVPTGARKFNRFIASWFVDHELKADMEYRIYINEQKSQQGKILRQ